MSSFTFLRGSAMLNCKLSRIFNDWNNLSDVDKLESKCGNVWEFAYSKTLCHFIGEFSECVGANHIPYGTSCAYTLDVWDNLECFVSISGRELGFCCAVRYGENIDAFIRLLDNIADAWNVEVQDEDEECFPTYHIADFTGSNKFKISVSAPRGTFHDTLLKTIKNTIGE